MYYKQRLVCTQLSEILEGIEKEYVSKIPKRVLNTIEFFKDDELKGNIDINKNLSEENLDEDTLNVLAWINYQFWTENDEEKEKLKAILENNCQEYEEKFNIQKLEGDLESQYLNDVDSYIESVLKSYRERHQVENLPIKKETILEKIKIIVEKNKKE